MEEEEVEAIKKEERITRITINLRDKLAKP